MTVDRESVISALEPDEPRYLDAARELGDEAANVLRELSQGSDVGLAAKAASLAGFLSAESARKVIGAASMHPDPTVRVSAAAALLHQVDLGELTARLLRDSDPGVRKWTLRALAEHSPGGFRDQVERIAATDEVPALAEFARQLAPRLPE